MRLSKEQAKHIESIRWLLGEGSRRSGRTYLLICVLIEEAIKSGGYINVIDHYGSLYQSFDQRMLIPEIEKIFYTHDELCSNYDLKIRSKHPRMNGLEIAVLPKPFSPKRQLVTVPWR